LRAAPEGAPDAPSDPMRAGMPARPATAGGRPDTAAPAEAVAEAERPAPVIAPAPLRGGTEPYRPQHDMATEGDHPPDVGAGGNFPSPAQRPSLRSTIAAESEAAARSASAPERTLPPHAAGIAATVLRAAEPRPMRAAAPSLSPPVSAGAIETLNAASAPPEPAPLRANPAHAPAIEPAGPAPILAEADNPSARAEATPAASARPDGGSSPARAPADTQGPPPSGATQVPTGQPAGQPGLGLSGPQVIQAAAQQQGQATARPAPATPAQQLMPVLVTLAAGTAGSSGAVTVTLDPLELGRVEISVRTERDAKARVHVMAERPETLLLLLRDQASLDRALAQAGVGAEGRTIAFDLAAGDGRGQGDAAPRDGSGSDRPGSARPRAGAETAAQIQDTPRRRSAQGALDIAV
jgi:hypothetical protein